MKKVLFLTSTFPRSESEVLAKWIGELAVRLKKSRYSVSVFAPSSRGLTSHDYHGIAVYRFRYAPKSLEILTQDEGAVFKIKNNPLIVLLLPLFFFFGFLNLFKLLINNHYDVIHVHWPFPMGLFGILAKWINRGKLVLTFYGAEFSLVRKVPLGHNIIKAIIKSADRVTAISTFTAGLVKRECDVPVSVIPFTSSFTTDNLGRGLRNMGKKKEAIKILFVGRLIERKGVSYLIKAIPEVLKKFNVDLEIVGSGPLMVNLKKLTSELKLNKKVIFYGGVDDIKLIGLYKKCDLFVLPSIEDRWGDTEGLGVVLLEAMGFKKPVVASNIGGITDIVKDGKTGLLVEQKNSSSLVDAILRILSDGNLRNYLSENGFKWRNLRFSWENTLRETAKIYD